MLLDDRYDDVERTVVTSQFGVDFAHAVFAAPPGSWIGPVKSAYGLHLVQVTHLRPGGARRFEDVRDVVTNDWRREREKATKAAYLAKLRDKYRVVIDPAAERLLGSDGSGAMSPGRAPRRPRTHVFGARARRLDAQRLPCVRQLGA